MKLLLSHRQKYQGKNDNCHPLQTAFIWPTMANHPGSKWCPEIVASSALSTPAQWVFALVMQKECTHGNETHCGMV